MFLRKSLFLFAVLTLSLNLYAQNYNGTYKGRISGDLEGTFEFTITNNYNIEGKIRGSVQREIIGYVDSKGVVNGVVVDKANGANYKNYMMGLFKGTIKGKIASGEWDIDNAPTTERQFQKGTWSTESVQEEREKLSSSYQLGNEISFTESKPIALRINIKLKDEFRKNHSLSSIELVPATHSGEGRFSTGIDTNDMFSIFTDTKGIFLQLPANSKEANFDFPSVDFGLKVSLLLPKDFTAVFKVKIKGQDGEQIEKLEVPFRINNLFTVGVQNCGFNSSEGCPRLKGKRISAGNKADGKLGDELIIPAEAQVWVKFLDGSIGYFINQTDVEWTLTMGFGKFKTSQGSGYAENSLDINAITNKALDSGIGKVTDKTLEKGLEILFKRVASQSSPGLVLQIMEFIGGTRTGGDFVSIRLRSEVGISLRRNGEIIVRNFEGNPEILQDKINPLAIPQGFQAKKTKGQKFGKVERYFETDAEVVIWKNKPSSEIPAKVPTGNSLILDAVVPGSLKKWSETYNPKELNPAFYFEEISLPNGSTAIQTRAVGNTLASCETKWIKRTYATGLLNSSNAVLEVTADFYSNNTTYNLPTIGIELLDQSGRSLGMKEFFGKNVIGSFNRAQLKSTGHLELSSDKGLHRIALSQFGKNIMFTKLAVYLKNYSCQGENSIILKRLEIKTDALN